MGDCSGCTWWTSHIGFTGTNHCKTNMHVAGKTHANVVHFNVHVLLCEEACSAESASSCMGRAWV